MIGRDVYDLPDPLNIQKNYGGADVIGIAIQTQDGDQTIAKTGEKIVLVCKIFRVPIMKYVLALPAGFKDPEDIDPTVTGLREMKEETGYTGKNPQSSYTCRTDPWKSDDRGVVVVCDIDLSSEENKNPIQNLEGAEDISCLWIKFDSLVKNLEDKANELN